jgi:hypothetical protein
MNRTPFSKQIHEIGFEQGSGIRDQGSGRTRAIDRRVMTTIPRAAPPVAERGASESRTPRQQSARRTPAVSARSACGQWEGSQSSARAEPSVGVSGATGQVTRCVCSARGLPPVSATPARSQRWRRRSLARRAPARRDRGAARQQRPDQRPARGSPRSSAERCHIPGARSATSEQAPPVVQAGPATFGDRRICLLENDLPRQCAGLSLESGSVCTEAVRPLARSGAGSARVSRSPVRDAVRGLPSARTFSRESLHPAQDTRCPARLRPIRTRPRPGDPCRAIAWRGRSASVLPPSAPRDPTVASRDPQPVLIDQASRAMVVTPDGLDDGGASSVNQYHGRRRSTQKPQSTQRRSSKTRMPAAPRRAPVLLRPPRPLR